MNSTDWIAGFYLEYSSFYPTGLPKTGEEIAVYSGHFKSTLLEIRATEKEARLAITAMVDDPPRTRPEHLQKLKAAIRAVRAKLATDKAHGPAMSDREHYELRCSDGCPECSDRGKPTGWAKRRIFWVCGTIPIGSAQLFCRCPYGRWRKQNDPLLMAKHSSGLSLRTHDLQAFPEIWDANLWHDSWSDAHARDDVPPDEFDGQWRFLALDEPTPHITAGPVVANVRRDRPRINSIPIRLSEASPSQLEQAARAKAEFERSRRREHAEAYEPF